MADEVLAGFYIPRAKDENCPVGRFREGPGPPELASCAGSFGPCQVLLAMRSSKLEDVLDEARVALHPLLALLPCLNSPEENHREDTPESIGQHILLRVPDVAL